jgi:transcriptional regulator with XRE-family HTH domain
MANQARRNFAKRLRALRSLHYEHAKDFAEMLGIEAQRYFKWEQGRAEPSIEMLLKICQLLGVTPTFLLIGDNGEVMPTTRRGA